MDFAAHRKIVTRYGTGAYLRHLTCRAGLRLADWLTIYGMTLTMDSVDPSYLANHQLEGKRVRGPELLDLVDERAGVTKSVALQAANRGDWCYVLSDRGRPISYGWYTVCPTLVRDDIELNFSPQYLYMYLGYTDPRYRGRRLHGFGMARGLQTAVAEGFRGLISFVEASNAASLRSVRRLGYRVFGSCYSCRMFGRRILISTPGCRPYRFGLRLKKN